MLANQKSLRRLQYGAEEEQALAGRTIAKLVASDCRYNI
jgi:hypothetical protein